MYPHSFIHTTKPARFLQPSCPFSDRCIFGNYYSASDTDCYFTVSFPLIACVSFNLIRFVRERERARESVCVWGGGGGGSDVARKKENRRLREGSYVAQRKRKYNVDDSLSLSLK